MIYESDPIDNDSYLIAETLIVFFIRELQFDEISKSEFIANKM